MSIVKKLSAVLLACMLFCIMSITAFAREVPDPDKTGSISISMTYDKAAVPGGTLAAYHVGAVAESDGNYSFTLTGDFTASGADLSDISSGALAKKLAKYASDHKLAGDSVKIGNDGKGLFSGLEPGLYLIVQTEAASGYEAVSPFLVSVPMYEDGTYLYDVDATPKMGTLKKIPGEPSKPSYTPPEPTLPQTGQLNWPIPVLAVLGICMFLLGWGLRHGRSR